MPSTASTSKDTASAAKPDEKAKATNADASQSLGVLEEDDEFEEFAAADWDDSETDLAHLGGAGAKSTGDKLWEDNWDDDDIEDDFSVQLRGELAKTKGASDTAMET